MATLKDIGGPEDLKGLSLEELSSLAPQIRDTIIDVVSKNGGHLASSLGVVELSLALHYVFESPRDKIIWDVGHQSYPHKLLTGRIDRFSTLRRLDGLAGFPKRDESPHDAFETGHSSTSISAALGYVAAREHTGEDYKVVAVIGDGSLTAGLAFEGLNHAGQLRKDLIVILNDNEMSISPNVGALSEYLNRILTGDVFRKFKKETKHILESIPRFGGPVSRFAQKLEESLKGLILPGMLFEELGFNYVGPIDGHNLDLLVATLRKVRTNDTPTLIHLITRKGRGYEFSEDDPCRFHGTGPFELDTGKAVKKPAAVDTVPCKSCSDVFGDALIEIAERDSRVVAITAAMKEGTGLARFAERFPQRIYDVGIAEPHAVTFAAGLAAGGARPVVAIYSTFLQRSYDEIFHDVCLQRLPVTFALDRAGIVGEDGPTHQGVFDLSYLRHIPGLMVMAPKDAPEMKAMLEFALSQSGPVALRFPRGSFAEIESPLVQVEKGKGELLRSEGDDIALIAIGNMVEPALAAAARLQEQEGLCCTVVNARFVKPLDHALVCEVASRCRRVITLEENALQGGFGSAVLECLNEAEMKVPVTRIGLPDEYVEQGTQAQLRARYGLDVDGIVQTIVAGVKASA